LAQLLMQGPLPISEALGFARQIAEALETAHDRGIVHRDLKPANVMLTPGGVVKVLDFGLAKAVSPTNDATAQAATFSSPAMTRMGIILGTAAYMSPEQARGRVVDARTDIWAFGCVLFEMITGRRPFDGETVTDILGAIVHKEPDWGLLPATLPDSLRRMLERCLAKDQKQRLHNIADVRLEIQDLLTRPRSITTPTAATGRAAMTTRERLAWGLAVTSLVAAAGSMWLWRGAAPGISGDRESMRVSILHSEGIEVGLPAISPDAKRVAYSARRTDGMPMIWIRDLTQSAPRPLAGTEGGRRAFWSPDSKRVGFYAGEVMKHISADGGPIQEVTRGMRSGASWGKGDVIVYGGSNGQIYRVSASGGQPIALAARSSVSVEHIWPSMLPDGKHFLYTARDWAGFAESGAQGIFLSSIDYPSDTRQLLPELSTAVYASPGYVLFARDGQLMAAPFSASELRITGEPIPIGESVAFEASNFTAAISAAADGTLAIRPPPAAHIVDLGADDAELTFYTRDGSVVSRVGGVQTFSSEPMALSPDGQMIASAVQDMRTSATELWRFDVSTGARTPMTAMRASGGFAGSPAWTHDGKRLAYSCQPPGLMDDVCVRDMQSGVVTTLIESKTILEHPTAWSTNGEYLLLGFNEFTASSIKELRVWSARTNQVSPYAKYSQSGLFSPDTRFVAFSSTESRREETYVSTFPERRQTWPLTTDGGKPISWSADGRELLVATLTGNIVAYPVSTSGGNFSSGTPRVLLRNIGVDAQFVAALRDHSRLLVRVPKDADKDHGEIRLLFEWAKGLTARPPF
ncbi:MAG: protein kinase, partial [Vicinamibacterales bacterium]